MRTLQIVLFENPEKLEEARALQRDHVVPRGNFFEHGGPSGVSKTQCSSECEVSTNRNENFLAEYKPVNSI